MDQVRGGGQMGIGWIEMIGSVHEAIKVHLKLLDPMNCLVNKLLSKNLGQPRLAFTTACTV